MFNIGDLVKCIDKTCYLGGYIKLSTSRKKRLMVSRVTNWNDGSQSIWVRAPSGTVERGPFISTRFELKHKLVMLEYDPEQQGDTDDDI